MATISRKISTLVESQLPAFISSEYENFSKFVEKYYEHLESQGQPLDIVFNVEKYRDINFYEKNLLNQFTVLTSNLINDENIIEVEDASAFPRTNGYIKIGNEICFYKERTDTQFLEVSRGVSGNTTLGDLYSEPNFVTSQSANHYTNDKVHNVSNLFLYAFVKSFESQYLQPFPEKYLKEGVDKRNLIKNIRKFYKSKGTDKSIKFIFNSIITKDVEDVPNKYNPKDFTLKASTSDWLKKYSLKVKILSGDPKKLIGNKIIQDLNNGNNYASAIVDNVIYAGEAGLYEIVLSPASINGNFTIASKTTLRKNISASASTGDRIDVYSTFGWGDEGTILIGTETISFVEKNVNQFVIKDRRNVNTTHAAGETVYSADVVKGVHETGTVSLLTLGILYNLLPTNGQPYSESGDHVQVSDYGVISNHPVVNNDRWFINTDFRKASSIFPITNQTINDLNSDVSAIFEDEQYFYICSSGYPAHNILREESPEILGDQKLLKLIRKHPTNTTEIYPTTQQDIGIFVDGTRAYSAKDFSQVIYGNIESFDIQNRGTGYASPPFVLINEESGLARSTLSGEVVNSIIIDEDKLYQSDPEITITSGRNAILTPVVTNGEITSITITNPGEYYSSAPDIIITDTAGKGNFAEYEAIVSPEGQIVECRKINGGRLYDRTTTVVTVVPKGSGAYAEAKAKRWTKDRFDVLSQNLDQNYSYIFENINPKLPYGYGVVANPRNLRYRLSDNINNVLDESIGNVRHSPILGFAYDGLPIYGPYGHEDPKDPSSSIVRLRSGYQLVNTRNNGPSDVEYPIGTFVEDYRWIPSIDSEKTILDQNNGRFCVTPEYPEGTYAYFITIEADGTPAFPYILGENYYSLPVDSNYNSLISQSDLPNNVKRLRTSDIDENGKGSYALIKDVTKGSVDSATVEYSHNNFSVGSELSIDNTGASGSGLKASVSSVFGKNVSGIESVETKASQISVEQTAYLFESDTIYQGEGVLLNQLIIDDTEITETSFSESSNVKVVNNLSIGPNVNYYIRRIDLSGLTQGILIGDVVNDNSFVLRDVNGTFNTTEPIFATIRVVNLLLDENASYSKGSILSFRNDEGQVFGTGEVLEGTVRQNSVKLRIATGDFFPSDEFLVKSNNLGDTSTSKIILATSLSENLTAFDVKENIAILQTSEEHGIAIGDKVNVEIYPDDSTTETTYSVKKRLFQTAKLKKIEHNSVVKDTGLGYFEIVNSGSGYSSGIYEDVELIFQNTLESRTNIGSPGDRDNAKATITVADLGGGIGRVTNIEITDKGAGYRKGDILTVADDDLNRDPLNINTQRLRIFVDHAGFSFENDELVLSNVTNLSADDYLKVGDEIVKITQVNRNRVSVTVERGQKNTFNINHFNNTEVTLEESTYRFSDSFRPLGDDPTDPYFFSYDKDTRTLVTSYDYGVSNPNRILQSTVFFDLNVPAKLVEIETFEDPKYKLEFFDSDDNSSINPIIDVQKYYKYRFDTSHFSMANTFLDFSSSINYNLLTLEKFVSSAPPGYLNSYVTVKFGFGANISSNNFDTPKDLNFTNYYYFIKASSDVDTTGSYLRVINDPLVGTKTVTFSTLNRFVYDTPSLPQYDGSGEISYTTTSRFAVGQINSVSIADTGDRYSLVPVCKGALPNVNLEALVDVEYDSIKGAISSVIVTNQGSQYSKPVAIVTKGDGQNAKFNCIVENGRVKSVEVLDGGSGFTYAPEVRIYESDINVYFGSSSIGVPQNVNIINNGDSYHNDFTTTPQFTSTTTFVVKDFDDYSFFQGEEIIQKENGVVIASARVAKNGWRNGSNLLKVDKIEGIFKSNKLISNRRENKFATLIATYVTKFNPDIRTYVDNAGYFTSARGKLSENSQKLADSYFYQDYSYVIKSKTAIDVWRDLISDTVHPAGFKLFGELMVESSGSSEMPKDVKEIEKYSILDLSPKDVSVISTKKFVQQSFVSFNDLNIERGIGSVSVDTFNTEETLANEIILATPFDGDFNDSGQLVGTTSFTILDKNSGLVFSPYNEQQLIITLDGVLQEPGVSYTVSGSQITFSEPPFGVRIVEGQEVDAVSFYGRSIRFKENSLNQKYLKKIKDISTEFDGQKTEFDLFYENDDIVKTDEKENLIVTLNGVLQNSKVDQDNPFGNSYYIERSSSPTTTDKIVFSHPPINHEDLYENAEESVDVKEKSFIYSVGSYRRLTVDENTIKYRGGGPYLIIDEVERTVVKVDDPKYALVFVNGVLQERGKAYNIVGPVLTFTDSLPYYEDDTGTLFNPDVSILLFYGRDVAKTLTFYNFEPSTFFDSAILNISGTGNFQEFFVWYTNYYNDRVVIYQGEKLLGEIKLVPPAAGPNYEFALLSNNFYEVTNDDLTFINTLKNDEFVLQGNLNVLITFNVGDDGKRKLIRNSPNWLFGSELGKRAYLEKSKIYANLAIGDKIKIDGEKEYREILNIPDFVDTKQYNPGKINTDDIYARVETTNYNDITRGEGLSITAEIDEVTGAIKKLNWNQRDLLIYFNSGVLQQPTSYQYFTPPKIEFIPQTNAGGGAVAEVIAYGGQILSVELLEGGYGYEVPPRVVVARGYNRVKEGNRKIDSITLLDISSSIAAGEISVSTTVTITGAGPEAEAIFSVIPLYSFFGNYKTNREITQIILPDLNIVTIPYEQDVKSEYLANSPTIEIDYEIQKVSWEIISTLDARANIISSVTIENTDRQLTRFIKKITNKAIVQKDTNSINDIGAYLDSPLSPTDNIVYIPNTRRFPSSSRLLIGKEIVTYEKKKSDRFLEVQRGTFGTTATSHNAGDYLRHLPELISIAPVGPTNVVQTEVTITEVHSTSTAVISVTATSYSEISSVSVEDIAPQIDRVKQIEIQPSVEKVIPWIASIVVPPSSILTTIHSTRSSVRNIKDQAIDVDGFVLSSIVTLNEINLQLTQEELIRVDTSDIQRSTEIVSVVPKFDTSVTSLINTINYNKTVVQDQSQIQIYTSIANYSSVIETNVQADFYTISSILNNTILSELELRYTVDIVSDTSYIAFSTNVQNFVSVPSIGALISVVTALKDISPAEKIASFTSGTIDYFTERIVLLSPIKARDALVYLLQRDLVVLRDSTEFIVENSDILKESIFDSYELGNAGFTLNSFESNAFISTGEYNVNGSIGSISLAYPNLKLEDFENRPQTAFTLSGEKFNLAIPSINQIGTTLSSNVSDTDLTIELANASKLPDSGSIIINKEVIKYDQKNGNILSELTRGSQNTIPSSHNAGDIVLTF